MRNIKLMIAYDGQAYLGWQKTSMGPSIEQSLQSVLEQILQHPVHLQAASRTDAHVHAHGQIVNFLTSCLDMDLNKFLRGVNGLISSDIVVLSAEIMPLSFHPTLDCRSKEYRYYICNRPYQLPQHRFYSWHVSSPIKIALIEEAVPFLLGRHHFEAFCNFKKNHRYTHYERNLQYLELIDLSEGRFYFKVIGDHFLYKMVRNIVGTLVDVGKGKIVPTQVKWILDQRKRIYAGVTAPAYGLFLHKIYYCHL